VAKITNISGDPDAYFFRVEASKSSVEVFVYKCTKLLGIVTISFIPDQQKLVALIYFNTTFQSFRP